MKKCPTCNKTFEDSMRFCQTDGTPLVDDEPAFDPYATIMAKPGEFKAPPAAEEASAAEPEPAPPAAESVMLEPAAEPAPEPIAPPDDVLDLPASADPLKTMYVSEAEMQAAFGGGTPETQEPPTPEPPIFEVPDLPAPSFGGASAPPSPFSDSEPPAEEPPAPSFNEAATIMQPPITSFPEPEPPASPSWDEPAASTPSTSPQWDEPAASTPPAAPQWDEPAASTPAPWEQPAPSSPPAEWTPPPAPDAAWQGSEIGSNTPFQPPPASGQSQGLAVGSLICGVLSCLCCFSVLTGPAAVIMGFSARKKANEDPSMYGGSGMAMAGIITGIVGFIVGVALIILQVFFGVLGSLAR